MGKRSDTLAGTLELLILKAIRRSSNHGFGIALYVEEASEGLLTIEEGSASAGAGEADSRFVGRDGE